MFGKNISSDSALTKLLDAQPTAGTPVVSNSVRMEGFQTIMFFGTLGTANPANLIKVSQSRDNGVSFAELAGASLAVSADGNMYQIEVYQPNASELRVEIDRSGANTATGEIWCLRMSGRRQPAHKATTVNHLLIQSPAEVQP